MMIVIGASLGGMKAMRTLLRGLPADFPEPIAAAFHRHREADDMLVHLLQQECALPVSEVFDKELIKPGRLYVAPADYHLMIERPNFSLSTDEPVQYARPSIDVLFESAADAFGPDVVALVLTGANQDGARGAAMIKARGGTVAVQDPETADSAVMPLAALEATGTTHIYSPAKLGAFLVKLSGARARG